MSYLCTRKKDFEAQFVRGVYLEEKLLHTTPVECGFSTTTPLNCKEMGTKSILPKPRKVRGTGIYQGDEFTFKPTEEGSPSQLNVRTTKGGKVFTTTSEKRPQQVAHLSCPADAADPWAEYTSQLQRLGITPQQPQALSAQQRLVNEGGMEVFLDEEAGCMTYQGCIDLAKSRNWQSEVMRQLQVIVRTLPAHANFIKVLNALKKKGGQHV